jgi:hypothetical protein
MRMESTQSVRYHSLSSAIFRLQACKGLLPTRPGYIACRVKSLCILVNVCILMITMYFLKSVYSVTLCREGAALDEEDAALGLIGPS